MKAHSHSPAASTALTLSGSAGVYAGSSVIGATPAAPTTPAVPVAPAALIVSGSAGVYAGSPVIGATPAAPTPAAPTSIAPTAAALAPAPPAPAQTAHRQRMSRRKQIQDQRLAATTAEKGLIIVHTGPGKGKTTAALGMVLRSLGHGYRVAIVQFIKGAWEPAEKTALAHWGGQLAFHAMGEGFSWITQDRARDTAAAQKAWTVALTHIANPDCRLILLDEINIALRHGYLTVQQVLDGLAAKPALTHVILTGRGAPPELIARADLVTEMTLIKHPLKDQHIRAQPGIEY